MFHRFVVSGETLFNNVESGSAKVFLYDTAYGLDNSKVSNTNFNRPVSASNPVLRQL